MKEYLTEWIRLNENFKLQDGDSSSVLALYQFADRLSQIEEIEAKKVLVDDFALPRPLTVVEEAERQEHLKDLPYFRYHPDPLATGAFEEGEEKICPCCGKK